ncbi:hypothetical protein [Streptomyces sp. NPDC093598]|uniref:hypothetical protein n=1 Tax=Streptomyces sp. NPDC093598 TaxID=3366046 RepID=UPI003826DF52
MSAHNNNRLNQRLDTCDPVTPGLAGVELRFGNDSSQTLDLTRDDGVWWLAIGNGDPVKP